MAKIRTVQTVDREVGEDKVDEILGNQPDTNGEKPTLPDPNGELTGTVPLFPDIPLEDVPKIRILEVHRVSPMEGFVGNADLSSTLEEIAERFGGRRLLIKVIGHFGHRYIKQKMFDIGMPPRKPPKDDDDSDKRSSGTDPRMDAVLEGLGSVHDRLDNNNGKSDSDSTLLKMFLTKSETEQRLAEIKLEELKLRQDADRERFDREMELKEKDIDNKLQLAKDEINLKKDQIEAERLRLANDAKEERTRSEKEAKEARESWERRQTEENQRRKDELDRIEASRKADLDRMRQEAKDKEERDRQFYAAQQEGQQKFQVLMAQLSKQKESNVGETVALIQSIRETFDGGDGEEKQDPMSKIMDTLPMVVSAIANRGMQQPSYAPPQRQVPQRMDPPPQQEVEIPMHSTTRKGKKGGKVMPAAPTAPTAQPKQMPPWASMLIFAVQYLDIELMGDIIDALHNHKQKPISDNLYAQITNAPIDMVKGYLRTINPVFTENIAVWNKLVEVREYLNTPPEEDDVDDAEDINVAGGMDFGSPDPVPPVGEPAKEAVDVNI